MYVFMIFHHIYDVLLSLFNSLVLFHIDPAVVLPAKLIY